MLHPALSSATLDQGLLCCQPMVFKFIKVLRTVDDFNRIVTVLVSLLDRDLGLPSQSLIQCLGLSG